VTSRQTTQELGDRVHRRFAALAGAGGIANSCALSAMARWVLRRQPKRILEVGAGIGTTTAAITEAIDRSGATDVAHVAVERIPYCVEQLHANLGARMDAVTLVNWPSEAPESTMPFDLVVIDGLGPKSATERFGPERLEAETVFCVQHLAPRAVVIVENRREAQRQTIEGAARPGWVSAHVQPWDGSPGYHLYLFDPTPAERAQMALRRAWFAAWFPEGPRFARRAYRKVTGRRLERRSLAATGPDYSHDGGDAVEDPGTSGTD